MKKAFYIFGTIMALASASCDDGGKRGAVNVYINGREALNKSADASGRLSAKEICQLGDIMLTGGWDEANSWYEEGESTPTYTGTSYLFMIDPPAMYTSVGEIDTANSRLRFRPEIVEMFERERESHGFFRESFKFVITDHRGAADGSLPVDTVAYVPTAQRMAVVEELLVLFDDMDGNWDRICELFNDAFVFIPCTGEEYKALEAAGLN